MTAREKYIRELMADNWWSRDRAERFVDSCVEFEQTDDTKFEQTARKQTEKGLN